MPPIRICPNERAQGICLKFVIINERDVELIEQDPYA